MLPTARHLLELAQMAVAFLPDSIDPETIRCHELARALTQQLPGMHRLVDGRYGQVDHSWIELPLGGAGYILDVYAVGRLPQVQLLQKHPFLEAVTALYKPGSPRNDIRRNVVEAMNEHLNRTFRPRMKRLENRLKNVTR